MHEAEYLLIKLGSTRGINFYKEHNDLIEKYGFVDFARGGKRKVVFERLNEPFFFIKESENSGRRIIKVHFIKNVPPNSKRIYPDYYEELNLEGATWVRITSMEIIDKQTFLDTFSLVSGKEIKALDRGSIPFFYVKKK